MYAWVIYNTFSVTITTECTSVNATVLVMSALSNYKVFHK